ncbi:MAG: PilN domain-containing protein [Nitrospinaceae bacterium]
MKKFYPEKSLGLDIREESLALTLLGKKLGSIQIIDAHFSRVPPLSPKDETSEKYFLEEINQFLMKNDIWPENVVISLPRNHFTFQFFDLPAPNLKAVDSMIEFELERHLSSEVEGLYIGYYARLKKENLFQIISAAIRKETANYFLDLLGRLNLKPTILDVPTFANVNLVASDPENEESLAAIIDLCPTGLDLAIIKNRTLEFSRNVPMNDPDFREAYFRSNLPSEHYEVISRGMTQIIVDELEQALSSCRNIHDSESIERIYLLGGGPFAPYLTQQLQEETDVSTSRVRLPGIMDSKPPDNFSTAHMGTALSLGLRELRRNDIEANLLPAELQPKKKKFKIKTTIGLSAAALLLLIGMFVNKIIYNNVTLVKLDRQLEDIQAKVGTLEKVDLEYESLKQSIDTLNAIERTYPSKLPVLVELTRTLPPDTWLTNIKFSKNQMEIQGYSSTASRLVPLLEQSAYFRETGFVGAIINESSGEKFTIRTEIGVLP